MTWLYVMLCDHCKEDQINQQSKVVERSEWRVAFTLVTRDILALVPAET